MDYEPTVWYPLYYLESNNKIGPYYEYDTLIKKYRLEYPVYKKPKYSALENMLIDDLIYGANTNDLDIEDHPIFKLHNAIYVEPTEQNLNILDLKNNLD